MLQIVSNYLITLFILVMHVKNNSFYKGIIIGLKSATGINALNDIKLDKNRIK